MTTYSRNHKWSSGLSGEDLTERHSSTEVPNLFSTRDQFCGIVFPWIGLGDGSGMIQVHSIYCALYCCFVAILGYFTSTFGLKFTLLWESSAATDLTGDRAQGIWEKATNTDEAWLAHLPLTSCSTAQFLTGHRPVLVCGLGVGDLCSGR